MKCQKRLPLLLGERDSVNWYVNAFVLMYPQTSISLDKAALGVPKGGQERPYHDTKCLLACTRLLLRLGHAVVF